MSSESENSNMEEDPIPASRSFSRRMVSMISIEPAIFMASLAYGLQSVISQVSFPLS